MRKLTDQEVATILHALRIQQSGGRLEGCAAMFCDHFDEAEPLTDDEIDELCESINFDLLYLDDPEARKGAQAKDA